MKRIVLFLLTNLLVFFTLSIVINLLGLNPVMTSYGADYQSLMLFCLVWGMGGAFISLMLSRIMAKWMMGVQLVDSRGEYGWLYIMVDDLRKRANLSVMPQVGVYNSPTLNAFATGPTKNRALVAVSTGLISSMNRDEIEGVVAHELAHIKNGDMVTMTLIQGVINAFVMFFARIISFAVSQNVKEESRGMVRFFVTIVLEIVFSILGMIVVSWFSRQREFRADKGSAQIAGTEKMIAALEKLQRVTARPTGELLEENNAAVQCLMISGKAGGLMSLLATHPPMEKRIAALKGYL